MAITVEMMTVDCTLGSVGAIIYIHGTGMVVGDMILTMDGLNTGFNVREESPYLIAIDQLINGFHAAKWGVAFRPNIQYPIDFFQFDLQCPVKSLEGIYMMIPSAQGSYDNYYNNNITKIPDPTIRTALIGG